MNRKKEQGVTLIAMVISIILLIILSTVIVEVAMGEKGLMKQSRQVKELAEQDANEEQSKMNTLLDNWSDLVQGIPEITVKQAKENNMEFTKTTKLSDELKNVVTIPGGFHIAEDSGIVVEEGIVIEDEKGNQFVWVPVGEYNIEKGEKLTNNLSRRTATESSILVEIEGDSVLATYGTSEMFYGEGNENSVVKEQINTFKNSANKNKGFYIGRYEAGTEVERTSHNDSLTKPVVQAHKFPYTYVTRDQAMIEAELMYSGNDYVVSELVSSYAYDTTLNFICQTSEKGYDLSWTSSIEDGNIETGVGTKTGEYPADKYSNIYDYLGNCWEWTTEYCSKEGQPNVLRGGGYSSYSWPDKRYSESASNYYNNTSFRVLLYIKEAGMTSKPQYTDIYVTRFSDGTLAFCNTETTNIVGKDIVEVYGNIKGMEYSIEWGWDSTIGASTIEANTPWNEDKEKITSVIFINEIIPYSVKGWFAGFTELENIYNLENLNTSKAKNMEAMFSWCTSLETLDLSSLDTSNVTNMESLFYQSTNLKTITFGENWDTSKVTSMSYMFASDGIEMSLTNIKGLEYFNTGKVEIMRYMFNNCSQLKKLNLSSFDTSSLTDAKQVFGYCSSLETIMVSRDTWDLSNANTEDWLYNCPARIIEI